MTTSDQPSIGNDLTYVNAPTIATYRAIADIGQYNWSRMREEDQNNRIAYHLERLWTIIQLREREKGVA